MPLIKSGSREAVGKNIREMVHAGHPQKQAVAAAMRIAGKYATGGGVTEGFLHSSVPGRTDKLPINVAGGSYVLPSDHVAALGQGNSLSGADIVSKMFKTGPYGMPQTKMKAAKTAKPKKMKFADGGSAGEPTPIIAAGGEIVLSPDQIIGRFGDLDHGHKALDQWVLDTRKQHIKTLKSLKPPKVD